MIWIEVDDPGSVSKRIGVTELPDEPGALLIGSKIPDAVRLPPELGGQVARVESSEEIACNCGEGPEHRVTCVYLAPGTVAAAVVCCPRTGFRWLGRGEGA